MNEVSLQAVHYIPIILDIL